MPKTKNHALHTKFISFYFHRKEKDRTFETRYTLTIPERNENEKNNIKHRHQLMLRYHSKRIFFCIFLFWCDARSSSNQRDVEKRMCNGLCVRSVGSSRDRKYAQRKKENKITHQTCINYPMPTHTTIQNI